MHILVQKSKLHQYKHAVLPRCSEIVVYKKRFSRCNDKAPDLMCKTRHPLNRLSSIGAMTCTCLDVAGFAVSSLVAKTTMTTACELS